MRALSSLRSRIFLASALLAVLCIGVAIYLVNVRITEEAERTLQSEIVSAAAAETGPPRAHQQRRRLFTACFFVGPFAEAATGFGVGQVAIVSMIQNTGISAIQLVLFALFSQILVPWGAMANGTMVGAALSGVSPGDLGVRAMLTAPLLLAWLVLYCASWPRRVFPARGPHKPASLHGSWPSRECPLSRTWLSGLRLPRCSRWDR